MLADSGGPRAAPSGAVVTGLAAKPNYTKKPYGQLISTLYIHITPLFVRVAAHLPYRSAPTSPWETKLMIDVGNAAWHESSLFRMIVTLALSRLLPSTNHRCICVLQTHKALEYLVDGLPFVCTTHHSTRFFDKLCSQGVN